MLIEIDIKHATWKKYEYVKKHVKSFIKWQYKSKDYPLNYTGQLWEDSREEDQFGDGKVEGEVSFSLKYYNG